jgi:DNA-binding MarR family transcriptional regulator
MTISARQEQHMRVLRAGSTNAYNSGMNMGTLQSLEKRGLVDVVRGRGSVFSPRTSIVWKLNDKGVAVLAEIDRRRAIGLPT